MMVHNNNVKVQVVRADKLTIDRRYQRYPGRKGLVKMARTFDWNAVGIPVVAVRADGVIVILDGQRRVLAMLLRWPDYWIGRKPISLLCEVRKSKGLEWESWQFILLNQNQRTLHAADFFHASAPAGDDITLTVLRILGERGIRVLYGPGSRGVNETRCGHVFRDAYETLGERRFRFMVRMLPRAFPLDRGSGAVEGAALTALFLRGLIQALQDASAVSHRDLESRLIGGPSAGKHLKESALASGTFSGWSRTQRVAREVSKVIGQ